MSSELQRIVDALGERLRRSVAIDDRRLRIQAYSPHFGPVDETRLGSILQRQAPKQAVDWVQSLGIGDATEPTRIPAYEPLGMLPRVCVPVIYQNVKLGYLWLIESDEPLTDAQLAIAASAAEAAGVVMYRERLITELERGREREFLRDLLSPDQALRSSAAVGLLEGELLVAGKVVVAVLRPIGGDETPDERRQVAIDIALAQARRQLPMRHALHLARPDHGVLVIAVGGRPSTRNDPVQAAEHLCHAFDRQPEASTSEWRAVVGIGEPQPGLTDTAVSYRQASQAARIAEILPTMGNVVRWSALGIYRTLAQLPPEELAAEALHPGLVCLLSHESAEMLLSTLECFLDLAGDVKAASAELNIHRASLYYRLGKIEQLAGVDLGRGGDRLALHLGLKIAHLAGLNPPRRRTVGRLTPRTRNSTSQPAQAQPGPRRDGHGT
ncbi:MAG: PucR family transcriptional regulator [Mycobacteriales bacterium]